jgi:hypothetical protein
MVKVLVAVVSERQGTAGGGIAVHARERVRRDAGNSATARHTGNMRCEA